MNEGWLIAILTTLFIFFARVMDVSIGTLRIICVTKGRKLSAALLGFLEISIWLLAISRVMSNALNPFYFFAYAGGFSLGNYVGIIIEDKLAFGKLELQVIVNGLGETLMDKLRSQGFGVTLLNGQGSRGEVKLLYVLIPRRRLNEVLAIINTITPNAFYSISNIQKANAGVFPARQKNRLLPSFDFLWMVRKAK